MKCRRKGWVEAKKEDLGCWKDLSDNDVSVVVVVRSDGWF